MPRMSTDRSTVSPLFLLFLVFLVLKLAKVITWSWWWVFSPLWIPFAIAVLAFILIMLLAGVFAK